MLSLVLDVLALLAQTPAPKQAPTGPPTWALILIALIGAGGMTGGLVALFSARRQNAKLDAESVKLRVEADVLPIDLAKGAVVVQSDVIKDLRQQLDDQDERIGRLRKERDEAERKRDETEARADKAYARLERRCGKVEAELERLRKEYGSKS